MLKYQNEKAPYEFDEGSLANVDLNALNKKDKDLRANTFYPNQPKKVSLKSDDFIFNIGSDKDKFLELEMGSFHEQGKFRTNERLVPN